MLLVTRLSSRSAESELHCYSTSLLMSIHFLTVLEGLIPSDVIAPLMANEGAQCTCHGVQQQCSVAPGVCQSVEESKICQKVASLIHMPTVTVSPWVSQIQASSHGEKSF